MATKLNTNIFAPLDLSFEDDEWEASGPYKERNIVRAIVYVPDNNKFAFIEFDRNDKFGQGMFVETSGGGMEEGENEGVALERELGEELGFKVAIITKLGVVKDYYNLINRANISNYYLVRKTGETEKHFTQSETRFKFRTIYLTLDEAISRYEQNCDKKLGRLICKREKPIVEKVKLILENL